MTLDQAAQALAQHRPVLYRPFPGAPPERGAITSLNDSYVFVRYGDSLHSQATRPEDLELEVP